MLSDGVFVVVRRPLDADQDEIGIEATELGYSRLNKIAGKQRRAVEDLLRDNLLKALRQVRINVPRDYVFTTLAEETAPAGIKLSLWLMPIRRDDTRLVSR